VEKMVK